MSYYKSLHQFKEDLKEDKKAAEREKEEAIKEFSEKAQVALYELFTKEYPETKVGRIYHNYEECNSIESVKDAILEHSQTTKEELTNYTLEGLKQDTDVIEFDGGFLYEIF